MCDPAQREEGWGYLVCSAPLEQPPCPSQTLLTGPRTRLVVLPSVFAYTRSLDWSGLFPWSLFPTAPLHHEALLRTLVNGHPLIDDDYLLAGPVYSARPIVG